MEAENEMDFNDKPAFKQLDDKEKEYAEPDNIFAQGLPDWSIEPPVVMVRRH